MIINMKKEADSKNQLTPLLSNSSKKSYFNYYTSVFHKNQLQRWNNDYAQN